MTSFQRFAELCQKVEGVSGSLEKIDLVAAFLADLDEDELSIASSFIMGTLFSPSLDLVIGVGPSILYEALARACGCSIEQISDMLRATGDPGLVAAATVEKRKPIGFAAFVEEESLSIKDVYQRLLAVARASGKRSQGAKVKNLQFLFSQANSLEAQYIARLAIEDMRIGIGVGGGRQVPLPGPLPRRRRWTRGVDLQHAGAGGRQFGQGEAVGVGGHRRDGEGAGAGRGRGDREGDRDVGDEARVAGGVVELRRDQHGVLAVGAQRVALGREHDDRGPRVVEARP